MKGSNISQKRGSIEQGSGPTVRRHRIEAAPGGLAFLARWRPQRKARQPLQTLIASLWLLSGEDRHRLATCHPPIRRSAVYANNASGFIAGDRDCTVVSCLGHGARPDQNSSCGTSEWRVVRMISAKLSPGTAIKARLIRACIDSSRLAWLI